MKKTALFLMLFIGFCQGCTSQKWVEEYVRGETSTLQETVNKQITETTTGQEELRKGQIALEEQLKGIQTSLETINTKLLQWQEIVSGLKDINEIREETFRLRSTIEKELAQLDAMEKTIKHLKTIHERGYLDSDVELKALANRIENIKQNLEMQVAASLKSQANVREFMIEEVRVLRLEYQHFGKEIGAIKNRLQIIEKALEKEKILEIH